MLTLVTGYSGVAIYTRNSKCCPIRAEEGITGVLCPPKSNTKFRDLPDDQQIGGYPREDQLLGPIDEVTIDSEGRTVILEFPVFVLIGVYVPATRDDTRTDFRMGFLSALDARIRNLVAMGKQVILAGDLNIIRTDIDTAGCAEHLRKEGMTLEDFLSMPSRRLFNQLVFEGTVVGQRDEGREEPVMWDITRAFHPERQGMFTCWETKKNARPGNFGSRIDYILCTAGIKHWFEDANIQEGLMGSDHCPVYATLVDRVTYEGKERFIGELVNPGDMFKNGQRLREWDTKDLLPQSAKLLNEFDRRRSIRDMFTKKPSVPKLTPAASSAEVEKTPGPQQAFSALSPAAPTGFITTVQLTATGMTASPGKLSKVDAIEIDSLASARPPSSAASPVAPSKRSSVAPSAQQPKKAKTAAGKDKTKPGPTQSSLKGFFKPKTSVAITSQEEQEDAGGNDVTAATSSQSQPPSQSSPANNLAPPIFQTDIPAAASAEGSGTITGHTNGDGEAAVDADRVFDPIESKESWSKLLGKKRAPPLCEHEEPCVSYVTKKPGLNTGKSSFPLFHILRDKTIIGSRWYCLSTATVRVDCQSNCLQHQDASPCRRQEATLALRSRQMHPRHHLSL